MVHVFLAAAVLLFIGAVAPPPRSTEWETVFERGQADEWISVVHASGRDEWFVAGSWGITRSTKGHTERRESPGHSVHGMVQDGVGGIFALGAGELVLHFDGRVWGEEHVGPIAHGRQKSADALLYSMFQPSGEQGAIAFGPRLILERDAGRSWTRPSNKETDRLMELAQSGPPQAWKAGQCEPFSWFWIGKDVGWASCRDGKTFTFERDSVRATGKKPSKCPIVVSVASRGGDTYVSCSNGTLWKAVPEGWWPLDPPADHKKELVSVSFAEGCLFVATTTKVWRRCGAGAGDK